VAIKNKYSLSRINDLFDQLKGVRMFSKIDLRSEYYQLRIMKQDVPKTTFKTCCGHYKFLMMLFWLTNALEIFVDLIGRVFIPYLNKFDGFYRWYSGVFLLVAVTQAIFEICIKIFKDQQLFSKFNKCEFWLKLVFLVHVISGEVINVDPRKVEVVLE